MTVSDNSVQTEVPAHEHHKRNICPSLNIDVGKHQGNINNVNVNVNDNSILNNSNSGSHNDINNHNNNNNDNSNGDYKINKILIDSPTNATEAGPLIVSPTHKHANLFGATDGLPPLDQCVLLIFGYGSLLWKQNFPFVAEYDCYMKGYKRVFHQGSTDHRGIPGSPGRVVTLIADSDADSRVAGKAFQLPSDPQIIKDILRGLDEREKNGYDRLEVTLYDVQPFIAAEKSKSHSSHCASVNSNVSHPHPHHHKIKNINKSNSSNNNSNSSNHEDDDEIEEVYLNIFNHPHFPQNLNRDTEKQKQVVCLCYIATEENEEYLGSAPLNEMAAQILSCAGPSGPNRDYLFNLHQSLCEMGMYDEHVFELADTARSLLDTSTERL